MDRPIPIFVGSVVGWRSVDILPEEPGRQVGATQEKEKEKEQSVAALPLLHYFSGEARVKAQAL